MFVLLIEMTDTFLRDCKASLWDWVVQCDNRCGFCAILCIFVLLVIALSIIQTYFVILFCGVMPMRIKASLSGATMYFVEYIAKRETLTLSDF